jgi:hypothetical protein
VPNELQQRILGSLREDGIAVFQFRELFDESVLSELEENIAPFVRETEERLRNVGPKPEHKDDFIVRRFLRKGKDEPRHRFPLDDPWLRLAVTDTVLDIVNSYRERWTKVHYVDNWFTVPYSGADKRIASQRWHRDPEEAHVVKVFLYLSNVDDEAGPFEYVRGSTTGGRYGDFWPWAEGELHPPEEELYQAVSPDDRVTLTGSAGTMFMCDTGGFHRGGFARTKPRILATWSFISADRGKGTGHRFEVDFEGREAELPAKVRVALG